MSGKTAKKVRAALGIRGGTRLQDREYVRLRSGQITCLNRVLYQQAKKLV
jgi:hypothetical protein